jgi:hypothetical protein
MGLLWSLQDKIVVELGAKTARTSDGLVFRKRQ